MVRPLSLSDLGISYPSLNVWVVDVRYYFDQLLQDHDDVSGLSYHLLLSVPTLFRIVFQLQDHTNDRDWPNCPG